MGSGTMSSWRYERFKTQREVEENTLEKRCARHYDTLSSNTSHPEISECPCAPDAPFFTECPCSRNADSLNQTNGCAFVPFDELPPEQQKVYRSQGEQIVDAVVLLGVVLFVAWVFRTWLRVRREDEERVRRSRAVEESKRLHNSGREFVRVTQPDDSVELAEIIVERKDDDDAERLESAREDL